MTRKTIISMVVLAVTALVVMAARDAFARVIQPLLQNAVVVSAVTALVVMAAGEPFLVLIRPLLERLEAVIYASTWRARVPKGYRNAALIRRLGRNRWLAIAGRRYQVTGLVEYDSKGERWFEFSVSPDDLDGERWLAFSGEHAVLWAKWGDREFWQALGLKALPAPRPVSMPFIEECLEQQIAPELTLELPGSGAVTVQIEDARRGSRTINLFGGSAETPAPYTREAKGVTGEIKELAGTINGRQQPLQAALYEYGESELLDELFIGIVLREADDLALA